MMKTAMQIGINGWSFNSSLGIINEKIRIDKDVWRYSFNSSLGIINFWEHYSYFN